MWNNKFQEILFFLPSSVFKNEYSLNNGNKLPMVSFGVSKIDGFKNLYESINVALEAGYRSFEFEPRPNQEEYLGTILQELLPKFNLRRRDLFLTGKLFPKYYGYNKTREAFLRTCCNLNTDYLDLYLMQWPGSYTLDSYDEENKSLRHETWAEMTHLWKGGAIRNIGVCNFEIKHLELLLQFSNVTPAVNQVEFHPKFPQKELLNYCKNHHIQMQATSFKSTLHPLLLKEGIVKKISRKISKTPTQVVLKWILNNGVAVISQSDNAKAIRSNYNLYDFVLEKPEMDALSSIKEREKYLMNPITVF